MNTRSSMIKRFLFGAALVGAGALATASQGCSYIANETAIQCASQEQCQSLGPAFANTTCDPTTRTCVQVPQALECNSNAECINKPGADPLSICRKSDRKCVALRTIECPEVLTGEQPNLLLNDDVIVLGLITPAGSAELGDAFERGADLAQRQITPSSSGTGLQTAPGKTKPLVIVSCREFNPDGFDGLLRGARHLVKDLEVPVVIGGADPTNVAQIARNVTLPNRVLHIAPVAIASALNDLPNPIAPTPLLWRLNWSDAQAVNVVQKFIDNELVPKLKADGLLGANEPLRIAILAEGDFKGTTTARLYRDNLVWNTKPDGTRGKCLDYNINLTPPACISIEFGDLNDTLNNPSPEGAIGKAVGNMFSNGGSRAPPHIILHSYATFGISRVLFPIEAGWDDSNYALGKPRPYHIGLYGPFNAFQPLYQTFIPFQEKEAHPPGYKPLSQRIFALYAHPTELQDDVNNFVFEFKQKFPDFAASSTPGDTLTRLFYDAVYMATYAIAANGDKPITGENLAGTLPLFVQQGAEKVKTGSADLQTAYRVLQTQQAIDVQGLSGNLDLDPQIGATKYSVEISCPNIQPGVTKPADIGKGGPYDQFTYSGFYFDEKAGTVIGKMPGGCPTLSQSVPPDVWPGL